MKASVNKYAWLIAYIDATHIDRVEKDLKKYPEYADITAYIPTIKLLRKSFKGKNEFEDVPLLFNYGFFKVPRKYAIYQNFLDGMKQNIACIFAWVKDPMKVIETKPTIRMDGKSVYADKDIPVATATSEEVAFLVKNSDNFSTHDGNDVKNLKPGDMVVLHGYPWDGVQATVIEVDPKKEEMKVEIMIFGQKNPVKVVSFDNIFFTVYHNGGYDDSVLYAGSIDAMTESRDVNKKQKQKFDNDEGNR
jgi:transcription antitermination factor NusG